MAFSHDFSLWAFVCCDYQLKSAVCLHECIFTGMTALHQAVCIGQQLSRSQDLDQAILKSIFFKNIHKILTFQKFVNRVPHLEGFSQIQKNLGVLKIAKKSDNFWPFYSYFCKKLWRFYGFLGTAKNIKNHMYFLANITIKLPKIVWFQ